MTTGSAKSADLKKLSSAVVIGQENAEKTANNHPTICSQKAKWWEALIIDCAS